MAVEQTPENLENNLTAIQGTADFQLALQKGEFSKAGDWLQYVKDNQDKFPQYQTVWEYWLGHRQADLEVYSRKAKADTLRSLQPRTKVEAQQELSRAFNIKDTAGFKVALAEGKIEAAKKWLAHVAKNHDSFPQYQAVWQIWLMDRLGELKAAEATK
jgi:hypothetical protein